ncbi:MAG: hypothetical protein AAFV88_16495 [Planctomycetota bacterium]
MNCEQFHSRVNELLDERESLQSDAALVEHAEECRQCSQTLSTWSEIDSLCEIAQPPRLPSLWHSQPRSLLAAAAIVLIAVTLAVGWGNDPNETRTMAQLSADQTESIAEPIVRSAGSSTAIVDETVARNAAPDSARVIPATWWKSVPHEDWVAEAMPSVQWVGDGVRPISRSMRRVIAILMNPTARTGSSQTDGSPLGDPVDGSIEANSRREQTSRHNLSFAICAVV